MSERLIQHSPERLDPLNVEWPRLLEEALEMPGALGATYTRFYNYSPLNQVILWSQGVTEPVNTFLRWQAMDRHVKRGSKAKAILRPIAYKATNELGEEESKVRGFKLVNCLFTVSDTEGEPLPEYEPKEWSRDRALGALAIRQVAFEQLNGNIQGYSVNNEVAINPVAAYPLKTLVHEIGHVVLGHTTPAELQEYRQHKGVREFQAEGSAYLVLNELDATDQMDAAESRAYIQGWLHGEKPDDKAIKQVFSTADKIIKAGRE